MPIQIFVKQTAVSFFILVNFDARIHFDNSVSPPFSVKSWEMKGVAESIGCSLNIYLKDITATFR